MNRFFAIVLLFVATLILPWWLWLLLGFSFLFLFKNFWEIIPIFFFSDLLFNQPRVIFLNFLLLTTAIGIIIYFALQLLKKYLRP